MVLSMGLHVYLDINASPVNTRTPFTVPALAKDDTSNFAKGNSTALSARPLQEVRPEDMPVWSARRVAGEGRGACQHGGHGAVSGPPPETPKKMA